MKRTLQFFSAGVRHCFSIVGSFVLWSVWLALTLCLGLQVYVLSKSELEVPAFVLRELETRLADSGFRATFGRAIFDPAGRILVENLRLSIPTFPDPVVTARSVYLHIDPWWLLVGRVEPLEIQLIDAAAIIPAMLAPGGQPVEIVSRLYGNITPKAKTVELRQLSGEVAGVFVSAHGTVVLPPRKAGPPFETVIADFVQNRFAALCRHALEVASRARQFQKPELHLEFAPSESGAAAASLLVMARSAELTQPIAATVTDLRARTRILLFGETPPSWLEFSASSLDLPGLVRVGAVQGEVHGRFQEGAFFFEPRELTITAASVEAAGFSAHTISSQVFPRPLPRLDITTVARIEGAPLAFQAEADVQRQRAQLAFTGELSPVLLTRLSDLLKVKVQKFFDFTQAIVDRGELRIGDKWKFERVDAQMRLDGINAYGVKMTDGRVTVSLDPERFSSPDAFARIGENFARGSYEHDLRTHEYRFLLDGRLRPIEISPWFREWWPNFFRQLEFPEAPPTASVDVRGSWRGGLGSSVFVFADAAKPIIRGTPLDRVRTRLFIRPGFIDGLEIFLTRHEGFGGGRFAYLSHPTDGAWKRVELELKSSLDLKTISSLLGPGAAEVLNTFEVSQPPTLDIRGRFSSPLAEGGAHQELRVQANTTGEFRFRNFPMTDASFIATWKDDELAIDDFEALVAGGFASGRARVWGRDKERRLGFDLAINEATLGQVASTAADFIARQKGIPPAPPGKFVQEKANVRLVFAVSAEGLYADPYSYRGNGSASLSGSEIAEIPLLGALSEVLKFTSLRFTEGQTNFKIEGPKISFPEVKVRGSNGAIDAHGTYSLEKRQLDFHARIFPFQESDGLIKTMVGVVLTPLSNAFEVKLSGTLDKPEWSVTLSPANLFRSLTPGDSSPKPESTASEPKSPPSVAPDKT
ncbi:MAG: AsmA-like C-terminal region-containing protein [Verrucomicrobiota bacterium]